MNYRYIFAALFVLCMAPAAQAQWTMKDFRKLKKLAGSWEAGRGDHRYTQEKWTRENDSTFAGLTYNIDRGVSILDERIKLSYSGGMIRYAATVTYQNKGLPVVFNLVSVKDDCYTFENKEHDFPQQIVYCLKSSNKLDVTVSGTGTNGPRTFGFHFVKK